MDEQIAIIGVSVFAGIAAFLLVGSMAGRLHWHRQSGSRGRTHSYRLQALRQEALDTSPVFAAVTGLLPFIAPLIAWLPLGGLKRSMSTAYASAGWPGGLEDDELVQYGILIGLFFALLAGAEAVARERGADMLLCSACHPALADVLRRSAFVPVAGNVHLLVRDAPDGPPLPDALDRWWITRADGGADQGL